MMFTEQIKIFFHSSGGAYSIVTKDEAQNSQLTLDRYEKEILFKIYNKDTIQREATSKDIEKSTIHFNLFNSDKKALLKLNYPKETGNEIRLYINEQQGFKPAAGDYWFIYIINGSLYLGSMSETEWHSRFIINQRKAFKEICAFCKKYNESEEYLSSNAEDVKEVLKHITILQKWLYEEFKNYRGYPLKVEISSGIGKFPKVPYICILPPSQKISEGIYVSICFGREGSGAVIGCAESVSKRQGLKTIIRSDSKPVLINVNGSRQETHYNDSYANPLEFFIDNFNPEKLIEHVKESLDLCIMYLASKQKNMFDGGPLLLSQLRRQLEDTYHAPESLLTSLISSLICKPFVILTGNSGTGKTKLAQLFAEWLAGKENCTLIPVGKGWEDNRSVVGFVNHLRTPVGGTEPPVYNTTPVLDLILKANHEGNQDTPFFLILDEMNLSHVECYFSDFLSAMESGSGIPLHSEGKDVPSADGTPVPETLTYPQNLFVIGTVNIDETTYMFSPKVLDRANVIEFRVRDDDMEGFLKKGTGTTGRIGNSPGNFAQGFLELSKRARGISTNELTFPDDRHRDLENCKTVVKEIFNIMRSFYLEFAYRTASEIVRYVLVDFELAEHKTAWNCNECMDAQILQKILPKLHGSKRRLETVLVSLAEYCKSGKKADAEKYIKGEISPSEFNTKNIPKNSEPVYHRSYNKLIEMIETVRRDQFVSFIQ